MKVLLQRITELHLLWPCPFYRALNLSIPGLYRAVKGGPERLCDLPRVTQLLIEFKRNLRSPDTEAAPTLGSSKGDKNLQNLAV